MNENKKTQSYSLDGGTNDTRRNCVTRSDQN